MEGAERVNGKLVTAVSGAVLVLALAGCGQEDNSEELDAWAKSVCDSVKPQVQGAQRALGDIAQVKPDEKPADLKKRLSTDIDALARSNSELATDIRKAGAPPVDKGDQLHKDAVSDLRASAGSYQGLKKKVDGLDTKDQAKFAEGLRGVGEEIKKLSLRNDQSLDKLQSGDIGRAMAEQQGCKAAASSGPADGPAEPSSGPADESPAPAKKSPTPAKKPSAPAKKSAEPAGKG